MLAIINNIAPHTENMARATSSKLLQLFATMSMPTFLLANETNHALLQSLLEAFNAIVEHQYSSRSILMYGIAKAVENPNFIFALFRAKRRFQTLREFTLEGGQQEIERLNHIRKDQPDGSIRDSTSLEGHRSPVMRSPSVGFVPEENSAFGIGDDDDDDQDDTTRASQRRPITSLHSSRAGSISSLTDDTLPLQLRGMSEKARGKMPAGHASFSRENSMSSSLHNLASPIAGSSGQFLPTPQWVRYPHVHLMLTHAG
jgi:hypothetical protein